MESRECEHGYILWRGDCWKCEVDEIRSRLQALEQNTVPSREAKQKPREFWLLGGVIHPSLAKAERELYRFSEPHPPIVRVREVLDE